MRTLPVTFALVIAISACATAPKSASGRSDLVTASEATLGRMRVKDPALAGLLATSAGYAVFPEIGKGGLLVGAAYGRGVLYQNGRRIGFVELNQGSLGAQIGAQTFSELIVFRDRFAVEKLKAGDFSLGANASAVMLVEGAASSADFAQGVAVFVEPRGGAMVEVSVSGQEINFVPAG